MDQNTELNNKESQSHFSTLLKPIVLFIVVLASVFIYQNCSPAKYKGSEGEISSLSQKYYWLPASWSSCVADVQTRSVECYDAQSGQVVSRDHCVELPELTDKRSCSDKVYRTYVQESPNNNKVDLFLIIDDSSSMDVEQKKLAERFGGFVKDLDQSGLDWQACYTTTDTYYEGWPLNWEGGFGTILSPSQEIYEEIFYNTIKAIGSGFSNDEQGIRAAHWAVQKNITHKCFREGAALSMILISDEDERSVGGNSALSHVQYQALSLENTPAALIQAVKTHLGEDKFFNFNSIVVKDATCEEEQTQQGAPGFIGHQYIELSNLTGGYSGSICSEDYTENLRYFQKRILSSLTEVKLGCAPVESDIQVTVVPPIQGFSYQILGQKINFSSVITGNYRLVINYTCQ